MGTVFDRSSKMKNSCSKHQEFLKRIKKTLYYGESNPYLMQSLPLALHVSSIFSSTHKNYSLKTLELDAITRIRQKTPCSLILTLIYLDRLSNENPAYLKLLSPQELFLVSLMVSTKFYSDYDEMEVFASAWAEEGCVDIERLKELEITFLNVIQWNIMVRQNEFYEKLRSVEKVIAMKEGSSRGSFTYTELELLMPSLEIIKAFVKFTTIIMFSYACSIATIAITGVVLASSTVPPTTKLIAVNDTSTTVMEEPTEMIMPDFDLPMINNSNNFTINFILSDCVPKVNDKEHYKELTGFPLFATKMNPLPFHW